MATAARFPAPTANITSLLRAARTGGNCSPGRVSQQLESSSPAVSSDAVLRASALGVDGRAMLVSSRRFSWTAQLRSFQCKELQCSSCKSGLLLRRRQQQCLLPRFPQHFLQVFSEPRDYFCPAGAAAGTSPHGKWCFTARHLGLSRSAGVDPEFPSTVRKSARALLHVGNEAAIDQRPLQGSADGAHAGRSAEADFTGATPKKKLEAVMLLRRRSGGVSAGECLKALEATDGDTEAAVVHLRKQGLSKAPARCAADCRGGLVAVGFIYESPTTVPPSAAAATREPGPAAAGRRRRMSSALVALTSETDFVAANARFVALAQQVARAAARTVAATGASTSTLVGTEQTRDCSNASVRKAEDVRKRSIKAFTTSSLLEAIKAAPVSESLLTVQHTEGAGIAAAAAANKANSVPEAARPSGDAAVVGSKSAVVRGSCSSDNRIISVSSALALLSQQFGEDVQLSDVKAFVVEEEAAQSQHREAELHSDNCSRSWNAAVGVYVHGQVAKDVGRAAAMVCLRWRSELSSLPQLMTPAEAEQLETVTHSKVERLAQLLCMQVIATRPRYVRLSDISAAEKNVERQILAAAAAASAPKRPAPASSTTDPPAGAATSSAADSARGGSFTNIDAAVEATLEGTLREQTLLEQEFLPLRRFHAEILTCDGGSNNSSHTTDKNNSGCSKSASGHHSSATTLSRTGTADTPGSKSSATSTAFPSRLTVKEAIQLAAPKLRCSTIDVESMQFLAVGQS